MISVGGLQTYRPDHVLIHIYTSMYLPVVSTSTRYIGRYTGVSSLDPDDKNLRAVEKANKVRGLKVIDATSDKIGIVSDLMVHHGELPFFYLKVICSGLARNRDKRMLLPLDVVQRIGNDRVYVDLQGQLVHKVQEPD